MLQRNLLQIRQAERSDIPQILAFIKALAVYENLSDQVTATEALLSDTLFSKNPPSQVLIAEFDGQPAGFALYFNSYSTFLARPGIYLEDLFVIPEMRKKGIGKALLKELAKKVVSQNGGRLEWSVLDWNQPAIDFYRSFGSKPQDEWTTFRLAGSDLIQFANSVS